MLEKNKNRLLRVIALARQEGAWRALVAVWRRLRHGRPMRGAAIDVFQHFDFVWSKPIAALPGVAAKNTLAWFIPDFNIGSGGHMNIFRMIWYLERMGFESTIYIVTPTQHHNAAEARRIIRRHFSPVEAQVRVGLKRVAPCEFAVATGWDTAYAVRAFEGARHKIYYVQDFEPWFFPMGSEYVLAENTYRFGFFGITAGHWLAEKLARAYGMQTHAVGFGVDQERFKRLPRREPHIRRVFFYARPPTPRRAFELGLLALGEVAKRLPQTHFIFAGWDTTAYHIAFSHHSAGTISVDELPDLFSQCDVALVLSLTNISLLPLELMACGCCVVSNRGDNVQWLLDADVAALADATPEALADAITALLTDAPRRAQLSARGEAFARARHWGSAAQAFVDGLERVRAAPGANAQAHVSTQDDAGDDAAGQQRAASAAI
ncbi:MAG: glycosyltransferase family 4 protein [Burkholderiaceae bacterium]|jgi:glycosyltransferase involved in cell wall biosynthesis|nr:glycosyltransferase family 4 protein [Burkholderiaceae bacterium]